MVCCPRCLDEVQSDEEDLLLEAWGGTTITCRVCGFVLRRTQTNGGKKRPSTFNEPCSEGRGPHDADAPSDSGLSWEDVGCAPPSGGDAVSRALARGFEMRVGVWRRPMLQRDARSRGAGGVGREGAAAPTRAEKVAALRDAIESNRAMQAHVAGPLLEAVDDALAKNRALQRQALVLGGGADGGAASRAPGPVGRNAPAAAPAGASRYWRLPTGTPLNRDAKELAGVVRHAPLRAGTQSWRWDAASDESLRRLVREHVMRVQTHAVLREVGPGGAPARTGAALREALQGIRDGTDMASAESVAAVEGMSGEDWERHVAGKLRGAAGGGGGEVTGAACRVRWHSALRPGARHGGAWRREEDARLAKAVAAHRPRAKTALWPAVAKKVGGGRSAAECMLRWAEVRPSGKRTDRTGRQVDRWAPEEDKRLAVAVGLYGEGSWLQVAGFVGGGRSHVACAHRWRDTVQARIEALMMQRVREMEGAAAVTDGGEAGAAAGGGGGGEAAPEEGPAGAEPAGEAAVRYRPWRREEDAALVAAVDALGTEGYGSWTRIAGHIPGRSAHQCRERFTNYLHPSVERGAFCAEEDAALEAAVAAAGGPPVPWIKVAAEVSKVTHGGEKYRTDNMCMRRWRQLRGEGAPERRAAAARGKVAKRGRGRGRPPGSKNKATMSAVEGMRPPPPKKQRRGRGLDDGAGGGEAE
ncbi:unnamed protein product [Pedinophyceae sp. YPF-701]|nr:unnamed protein product [Pedinophyceae sp. YPF-701]